MKKLVNTGLKKSEADLHCYGCINPLKKGQLEPEDEEMWVKNQCRLSWSSYHLINIQIAVIIIHVTPELLSEATSLKNHPERKIWANMQSQIANTDHEVHTHMDHWSIVLFSCNLLGFMTLMDPIKYEPQIFWEHLGRMEEVQNQFINNNVLGINLPLENTLHTSARKFPIQII